MVFRKFFILLPLFIFCCLFTKAQDTDYVYKDSSVIAADSVTTRSLEVGVRKNNWQNTTVPVDTLVQNTQLSIAADSAEALKNESSFAYAKNLDSVLKVLQSEQHNQQEPSKANISWLEKFFFSPITKTFLWILGCLFIGFILYKLFFTEGFFQRQTTLSNVTVLPEEKEHSLATADYNMFVAQSVAAKNYRLAIRYHYLQVLQMLASKGTIQFTVDKTNAQYIRELKNQPYKNDFVSLTLHYEYAWYGRFYIDEKMFEKIQNHFKKFTSLI